MEMSVDDNVFKDVCDLLHNNRINFWICHGTLLGIIRENRLLPWDHDIDFAVWDHETDKSHIVDIMLSHGYQQEVITGEMDCLHFLGEEKKVDISFYKIKDNIASIKWAISPKDTFGKLMLFVSNNISKNNDEILINHSIPKKAMLTIIRQFSLLLGFILPNKLKTLFNKKAMQKMKYTGYSYPMEIMQLKNIEYAGMEIPVPFDSEACLQHTYGKDWKTPKKNYIWYEEADNLIKLRMK
jgi:hypothetical protein